MRDKHADQLRRDRDRPRCGGCASLELQMRSTSGQKGDGIEQASDLQTQSDQDSRQADRPLGGDRERHCREPEDTANEDDLFSINAMLDFRPNL
ncbi:hypothetical protein [Streptomyces sp. NBC_01320]|uniref:hypothetical protein n=1 Tax=Streptomyces sp. NBC_01320 TaxID=2903824 RepID=UPI002E1356A5|nr:hypothetical protein OG395_09295 [Streptomyces sp. NBC_01320]